MSNSFVVVRVVRKIRPSEPRSGCLLPPRGPANERFVASAFSSGKAPPADACIRFDESPFATEKTKRPEPVFKPIRALLPDTSLAALAAGVA
jgi:hypothetical protein